MRSKGHGNRHGQGEAGIGVPVWYCRECNTETGSSKRPWQDHFCQSLSFLLSLSVGVVDKMGAGSVPSAIITMECNDKR